MCLLGENVHVVLNSESHWIYIEQVRFIFPLLTLEMSVDHDHLIIRPHWTDFNMVRSDLKFFQ